MSLADDSRTAALAALISQIQSLVNTAANTGNLFVSTNNLYVNQQTYLTNNGYVVTQANGLYKISWESIVLA